MQSHASTAAPADGSARVRGLVLPLALVLLGIACWALSRSTASSGGHSYSAGGTPRATVQLTRGHTYDLAIPGGIREIDRRGLDATRLSCTATGSDGVRARLVLQAEASDTKAVNQFATFSAPDSGSYAVACAGLAAVFVDDADNARTDRSGLLVVVAVFALTIGLALLLSALRERGSRAAAARPASVSGE